MKKKEKTYTIEVGKPSKRIAGCPVYVRAYDPNAAKKLSRIRVVDVVLPNKEAWDERLMRVLPTTPNSELLTKRILDSLGRVKHGGGSLIEYLKWWVAENTTSHHLAYMNRAQKLINKLAVYQEQLQSGVIDLVDVNYAFLDNFWNFLSRQKVRKDSEQTLSANAMVDYFKLLNTILRNAEKRGDIQNNPFDLDECKKFTRDPTEKVVIKEALSREELKCIEVLQLDGIEDTVRDLFLFSFFTRGMRFEDCISITWNSVKGDTLEYKMQKNGKFVTIEMSAPLLALLHKYEGVNDTYIFPLLKGAYGEACDFRRLPPNKAIAFSKEKSKLSTKVNRYLKKIASKAGVSKNLAFHIARHTFATLYDEAYGTEATQAALCHSNIRTTLMYLDKEKKADELKRNTSSFYQMLEAGTNTLVPIQHSNRSVAVMHAVVNPKYSTATS